MKVKKMVSIKRHAKKFIKLFPFAIKMFKDCKQLQIETTRKCNLKCKMCERSYLYANDEIPVDMNYSDFTRLIDKTPHLKILNLTGLGEPLLNKDIFEMIKYAKSKGINVRFSTNGTIMNEKIAEFIIKSGLDMIGISIESANPSTYEKIRVGAKFDKVVENIKLLVETKKKLNSKTPEIRFGAVLTDESINSIEGLLNLAKKLNVNYLAISPLIYEFKEGMKDVNFEEIIAKRKEMKKLAQSFGITLGWTIYRKGFVYRQCLVPFLGCYVDVEGFVGPCCMITQRGNKNLTKKFLFGNIFEEDFGNIWNSKKFNMFREKLLSKEFEDIPEVCKNCNVLYFRE